MLVEDVFNPDLASEVIHLHFTIECEGWRRHSSLIFLILLFTKPNIEVSGWLYRTKTHIIYIVYQPFSRVTPPNHIALTLAAFGRVICTRSSCLKKSLELK